MASITLDVAPVFAEGLSVGAYPAAAWGGSFASGAPIGTATETKTVTGGQLAFTTLTETDYYAVGEVDTGVYRYIRFSLVPAPTPIVPASDVTVEGLAGYPDQQAFDEGFAESLTNSYFALFETGSLLIGNGAYTPAKLSPGTDGQVLKMVSGKPAWAAP